MLTRITKMLKRKIWRRWYLIRNYTIHIGKFLGISRARINSVPSSHIHGRLHHEFNEWTLLWMWEERASFSLLGKYLRIIHLYNIYTHQYAQNWNGAYFPYTRSISLWTVWTVEFLTWTCIKKTSIIFICLVFQR